MEETKTVTGKDIAKHYFSSLLVYGAIFIFFISCPLYYQTIEHEPLDYTTFLGLFFLAYAVFAPIVLFIAKPATVLNSRTLTILRYFKRLFVKCDSAKDSVKKFEPDENEKQAFVTLFVQSFFGVFCLNSLCNDYLASFEYNMDFLATVYEQAQITFTSSGLGSAIVQFLTDSGDMWIRLVMFLMLIVLMFSYFTDSRIFGNKIKSVDTTPMGIVTCIMCYYPLTILTSKIFRVTSEDLLPVGNLTVLASLNFLAIIAHLGMLFAVLRLGTKAGNLTNRGIETKFPYNIVRHPEYSMYILYILITTVPFFLSDRYGLFDYVTIIGATFAWMVIYYLRAVTEERHLMKDEAYVEYTQKVKYRFLPWII